MLMFLKGSGIVGSILAILALVILLLKSIIAFIGFLTGAVKILIILIFILLLVGVGVMVLRATRPEIARPYRVWAYPIPPIIFSAITLWMMFYLLLSKTSQSLAGLATALVGLLLYFCARRLPQRS